MPTNPDLLFQPFDMGRYILPNRLVMAPMTRALSAGGLPGPDVAAYYRRRVEGGLGLIIYPVGGDRGDRLTSPPSRRRSAAEQQ